MHNFQICKYNVANKPVTTKLQNNLYQMFLYQVIKTIKQKYNYTQIGVTNFKKVQCL